MVPRRYGFSGSITSAATKTIWSVTSTATIRGALYDIFMSSNATPADNASEWWALRFVTTAGTSTAVTPTPLDFQDPAAICVCGKNHSAEPTGYQAVPMLDFAVNQRATFRWVAAPGSELEMAAAANNGIGLQCQGVGGSGVVVISTVLFME